MTKSLAVKEETNTNVVQFNENAFAAYSGAGGENVTREDYKLPLLKLVELLSQERKKSSMKYLPEAEAGDIVDTSVNQLFGNEIEVAFVSFQKEYVEWKDNRPINRYPKEFIRKEDDKLITNDGKEFVYSDTSPKGFKSSDKSELVETKLFFVINITAGGVWSVIPMAKGRLKAADPIINTLERLRLPNGEKAPWFYNVYKLKSVATANPEGQEYNTWKMEYVSKLLEYEGSLSKEEIYKEATSFHDVLKDQSANVYADYQSDVEESVDPNTQAM